MRRVLLTVSSAISLAALTSCGTPAKAPITFSLEQLGAEAATRSDGDISHRSSVSITGIAPPYAAGKLLSVPGRDLPDLLSVPIVTSCSRIVETRYDSDASTEDVTEIAAAIESLRGALVRKAIAETKLQVLSNARATFSRSKQAGSVDEEPLLKTYASVLGLAEIDEPSLIQLEQSIRKEIDEAGQRASVSTDVITKLGSKPNVFIFRWAADSERSVSAAVGSALSGTAGDTNRRSGYLVAASLRSSALEYGDDLVTKLIRDKKFGKTGADSVLDNPYIVNFTLGAKHHYFSEDRDIASAINAAVRLSASDLDKIFGGGYSSFLQAQSLAVDAALKSSITASARGMASEPKRKIYPFRLWGDSVFAAGGDAERKRNEGYTTFYSTRSNLADYVIDESKESDDAGKFQCMQSIPFEGAIQSTSVTKVGFKFCSPKGWNDDEGKALGKTSPFLWEPDKESCIELDKSF